MVLVLAEDRESNLSRAELYTYEDTNITGSPCGSFGRDANSQHLDSHFVNLWFKPHRRILFFYLLLPQYIVFLLFLMVYFVHIF